MGPRDRDDLMQLLGRIKAIEQSEQDKAPVCREIAAKLQRCLASGWLPEVTGAAAASTPPAAHGAAGANASWPRWPM